MENKNFRDHYFKPGVPAQNYYPTARSTPLLNRAGDLLHLIPSGEQVLVLELLDGEQLIDVKYTLPEAKPATATFTGTGTGIPLNGQQFIAGSKTYTFETTLTNVDGNIHIKGSLDAQTDAIVAAINLGAGSGTDYAAAMTVNPDFYATKLGSGIILLTAKTPGAAGNSLATTDTADNWVFGAATAQGGSNNSGKTIAGLVDKNNISF